MPGVIRCVQRAARVRYYGRSPGALGGPHTWRVSRIFATYFVFSDIADVIFARHRNKYELIRVTKRSSASFILDRYA